MVSNNKFQEKIKTKIVYLVSLVVLFILVMFYVGSLIYNDAYTEDRLSKNNDILKNKVIELFEIIDKQNVAYLSIINSGTTKEKLYGNLYKTNNILNGESFVYIVDDRNEMIFTNDENVENKKSFNNYLEILVNDIKNGKKKYMSIKPSGDGNQLLIGNSVGQFYSITKLYEDDICNYIDVYNQYVITNDKGHVIAASNKNLVNNLYKFSVEKETIELNGQIYKLKSEKLYNGIIVTSFILNNNIIDLKNLLLMFFLVFVVVSISLDYFSDLISKNTTKSLDIMVNGIDDIKNGKSKYLEDINTNDEFEVLSKEINRLLENIENLNNKNINLNELNKQIEIKQLESQFNPHFLYNTLETIRYVMFEDKNKASSLIMQLTSILRYSISNKKDMVKVNDDIVYIKNYLEIMKVRFQERFNYTIKLDEKCKNIYIPKLIFQPIIENSIKHNYIKKDKLSIWVTVEVVNNDLVIEIEDDGEGINEKDLNNINLSFETNNQTTHIGLNNVYRRLKLKYHIFDFKIYSRKEIGTKIILTLPIEDENV